LAKPFLKQMNLFDILPEIKLEFNEPLIPYKDIENFEEPPLFDHPSPSCYAGWNNAKPGCSLYIDKKFDSYKINPNNVLATITASCSKGRSGPLHYEKFRMLTKSEVYLAGSFPLDYECKDPYYFVGMSVPPIVMAQISSKIYEQWLININN
jgi:DNA (cytosine-5)-methyltransferase 1